jgi:hypothetical protein
MRADSLLSVGIDISVGGGSAASLCHAGRSGVSAICRDGNLTGRQAASRPTKRGGAMQSRSSWIAAGIAAAVVAALVVVSVGNWERIGDVGIGLNGWIALVLGIVVTMAVGIGLMALIFISNRRGYDEPPDKG